MKEAGTASLKLELKDFVRAGSTEVTPHDEKLLSDFARVIPAGYRVYVAHTPKASLDDVVRVAIRLQSLGLRASPHIVARRVASLDSLRESLTRLSAAGVDQLLVIAGDRGATDGQFSSSMELLETGLTVELGFRHIGVAGHPEGHPSVPEAALWEALARKQAFGGATGTAVHIATQFGFDTRSLGIWERALAAHGIHLPIHAGVAGPTPLAKLLKYAVNCGVGASLKAVAGNAGFLGKLPHLATQADQMLLGALRRRQENAESRIFAPHFFAFGGVLETARWLRAITEGAFELSADERGFSVDT